MKADIQNAVIEIAALRNQAVCVRLSQDSVSADATGIIASDAQVKYPKRAPTRTSHGIMFTYDKGPCSALFSNGHSTQVDGVPQNVYPVYAIKPRQLAALRQSRDVRLIDR